LALGIRYGECFGFLGPNGAGKTTTINVLCGLYRPSSGTAFADGYDIRSQIDQVHQRMGVCPQDNVLWDDLTGPEHLEFYGKLKNVGGKKLKNDIQRVLETVNLHNDKKKKVRQYSGGMKRRLSLACSIMGDPMILLMDEPSTGLDPASRRQLWDLINKQKKKCVLILTSHSMEEADALCDRVGIFVGGELKCIGSSSQLKQRFGKGYKVTITVSDIKYEDEAQKFLLSLAPDAILLHSLAGTANYEIPKAGLQLSTFFEKFEEKKENYHITDWGISNTTLEEVFQKIMKEEDAKKSWNWRKKEKFIS